ncbi:hypothetical protein MBLNU459_g4960t1 [Dothideomycetes sp. NU459]
MATFYNAAFMSEAASASAYAAHVSLPPVVANEAAVPADLSLALPSDFPSAFMSAVSFGQGRPVPMEESGVPRQFPVATLSRVDYDQVGRARLGGVGDEELAMAYRSGTTNQGLENASEPMMHWYLQREYPLYPDVRQQEAQQIPMQLPLMPEPPRQHHDPQIPEAGHHATSAELHAPKIRKARTAASRKAATTASSPRDCITSPTSPRRPRGERMAEKEEVTRQLAACRDVYGENESKARNSKRKGMQKGYMQMKKATKKWCTCIKSKEEQGLCDCGYKAQLEG